jgi:SAM-dependent methyltransferase
MSCVLCAGETISTVQRAKVPTLQNRVYVTAGEAGAAKHGRLDVQACRSCGYAFNTAFDASLMEYDENYNNEVPSRVFDEYYRQIAAYLKQRYLPQGGVVLDIGCGKGQFLQTMTGLFPYVCGIGVDPSCRAYESERLKLVPAAFPLFLPESTPDLVVCRHTLEHIPNPMQFIRAITELVAIGTPVFFEVPDAAWIVRSGAFWDWCYEHVNYFVAESAAQALTAAGIGSVMSTNGFGGQYLWLEGRVGKPAAAAPRERCNFAGALLDYAGQEAEQVQQARRRIQDSRRSGSKIAVWGMATKGIEFVALVDPAADSIDYCVDMNPTKQGKYTPTTARMIQAPTVLEQAGSRLEIIVMNPCYLQEIREECRCRSIDAQCVTM